MKKYHQWHTLKTAIDAQNTTPLFKEREIWWCSIGENVGHEQNGKGQKFNRPVLVIKKFNRRLFWGIPLSSKIKDSAHYHHFTFNKKQQSALLTQMRLWDANRMTGRMGRIGGDAFDEIKTKITAYLQ